MSLDISIKVPSFRDSNFSSSCYTNAPPPSYYIRLVFGHLRKKLKGDKPKTKEVPLEPVSWGGVYP